MTYALPSVRDPRIPLAPLALRFKKILGGAVLLAVLLLGSSVAFADGACSIDAQAGTADSLYFVTNETDTTVNIYWVDPDCNEQPRGQLAPGATFENWSRPGHMFRARNATTNELVYEYTMTDAAEQQTSIIPYPYAGRTLLLPPETMQQRAEYVMNNHYITFQDDGNFCVRRLTDDVPLWCLNTVGVDYTRVARVTMQEDGNLAAYDSNDDWVWSALHENPDPNARLILTPDGGLELYSDSRGILWRAEPTQ